MIRSFLALAVLLVAVPVFSQQVGIGTVTPDNSAQLDVSSSSKGFLPPRMTTAERNAITNPAAGLMIFNTSTGSIEFYNGTFWISFGGQTFSAPAPPTTGRRLLGGTGIDQAFSIQATADGGFILGGNSTSGNSGTLTGINNNGQLDLIVAKLDASATIQ